MHGVTQQRADCQHTVASPTLTATGTFARAAWDLAAAKLGAVFHVVVEQKRIMEEFERGGGEDRLLRPSARSAAGGEADGRPQSLAFTERIVGQQVVKRSVAGAPALRKDPFQLLQHIPSRFGQNTGYQFDIVRHVGRRAYPRAFCPSASRTGRTSPACACEPGSLKQRSKLSECEPIHPGSAHFAMER